MMGNDEFEHDAADAEPLDMLASYFEANGWAFEQNGEDEIAATTQGSWTQYEIRAIWRADKLPSPLGNRLFDRLTGATAFGANGAAQTRRT